MLITAEVIRSHTNRGRIYADAYVPVREISLNGHVAIVEGPSGNRFPVTVGRLIEVSRNQFKEISQCLEIIREAKDRRQTSMTAQKIQTAENKIKTILWHH